jgi:nucleoside 2-deoxyribosyltransferase
MSLRVYVAGPSARRASIAVLLATLRAHGAAITFDWPAADGWDRDLSEDERAAVANRCLWGVTEADLVWVLLDAEKSEGAAAELGIALTLRDVLGAAVEVIASGPLDGSRVFPAQANQRFEDHEAALGYVLERLKAAA